MKICKNCGNELHDDSVFCFNCMTVQNIRKTKQFDVRIHKVRADRVICAAAAVTVASAVIVAANAVDNASSNDVPKAQAVTGTPTVVTTIPPSAAPTEKSTQTVTQPPVEDIIKIAQGIENAATGSAATTTTSVTTTTETAQSSEDNGDNYVYNDPAPDENTYDANNDDIDNSEDQPSEEESFYSSDGAHQMTLDLLDYVNPIREKYGLQPLRACGQLDELLDKSVHPIPECGNTLGIGDPYEHLEEVGLPNTTVLRNFHSDSSGTSDRDKSYSFLLQKTKDNITYGNVYGDDLLHGLADYKYVGTTFFYNKEGQESAGGPSVYICCVWVMK